MKVRFLYGPKCERILSTEMDIIPNKGERIQFADSTVHAKIRRISPDIFNPNIAILLEVDFKDWTYTESGFVCEVFLK